MLAVGICRLADKLLADPGDDVPVLHPSQAAAAEGADESANLAEALAFGSVASAADATDATEDTGAAGDRSFAAAGAEAEADFAAKLAYVEELLHAGALTPGDLIEAVRSQQFQIGRLRKELHLLRRKLLRAGDAGFSV